VAPPPSFPPPVPLPAPDELRDDDGREVAPDGGVEVGDLVVIPVPRVRAQIGCGERVGVVLEDRRSVVKVFFPEIDRTFWIERDEVLPIPPGRLPSAPLATRLHRIAKELNAVAVEIYDRVGDADAFHVYTRGTDLPALQRVRETLGDDFRRLDVDPGGVRRARLTLVFRTTPA
jgi:hypothetical protein